MSDISQFVVVLPTPIGVVALSADEWTKARRIADNLLCNSEISDKQDNVGQPTRLVDARTIAKLFSMDATWFLTRAREGRLPHVRLGKFVRFDPVEIRDFFHQYPDRHANL